MVFSVIVLSIPAVASQSNRLGSPAAIAGVFAAHFLQLLPIEPRRVSWLGSLAGFLATRLASAIAALPGLRRQCEDSQNCDGKRKVEMHVRLLLRRQNSLQLTLLEIGAASGWLSTKSAPAVTGSKSKQFTLNGVKGQ
jgi:hypothetical protein